MPIISYAQNFEDVILWRALKHVERGFYIDVGAQDPVIDSVSLAFYEQGWRGVHVEPTKSYAEKLREARPDETVIQAAIGARRGRIPFWEFPDTGLSTGDPAIAKLHRQQNRKCAKITVSCMRLSQLLERYRGNEIHWLKIDVEGMERSVIQSWRPSKARPWIVVVESTKPLSTQGRFRDFDPVVVKLGYDFVYFDGVNRFYVSREHPELKATFGPGPNFFDHAVLASSTPFSRKIASESADLRNKLTARTNEVARLVQSFEADLARLNQHISNLDAWREAATVHEASLRLHLAAVYDSTSWRVTAPLRFVSRTARWLVSGSWAWITLKPGSRPRRRARRIIVALAKQPGLVVAGKALLASSPSIRKRIQLITRLHQDNELRSVVHADTNRAINSAGLAAINELDLSTEPEGVRQVYRQLSWARKASLSRM